VKKKNPEYGGHEGESTKKRKKDSAPGGN
jgi:hypothetical protein